MKKYLSILQYILFLGGGLFLVWWQLRNMTPEQVKEFYAAFRQANYWLVIPVVFMSLLSHLSRAMRWKLLLEQLGYEPKLKNMFSVTMIGYLANAAIPRLGEILKCTFLSKYEKLKVDKLVGTIIVERTFDLFCFALFIGITLLTQLTLIGDFLKKQFSILFHPGTMPYWLGGIILLLLLLKFFFKKYPNNKFLIRVKSFFMGMAEGFKTILNLKKRRQFILHTIFIWSMYLLQIFLGFQAMQGTSHLGIDAASTVLIMATLAMIITPNGIGIFPPFVMATLVLYGISEPSGKAFGWLIWSVSTGIIIVVGLTCLTILPYINRKKDESSQQYSVQDIH